MFKFLLVDATNRASVIYRADPEIPKGALRTRLTYDVELASSLFGNAEPILCWDTPTSSNYKKAMFPAYKQKREELPGLAEEIDDAKNWARQRFFCWEHPDYEADDLIATAAKYLADEPLVIYSTDKDFHGLLMPGKVRQQLTSSAGAPELKIVTWEAVETRYGVKIAQWLEYRALVGDPSDNLPGVPDIGDKTATTILSQYPTVAMAVQAGEGLRIQNHRREKLHDGYNQGLFEESLKLTKLRDDAPIPKQLEELVAKKNFVPPAPF